MIRRPPRSSRTIQLFPSTTLSRSFDLRRVLQHLQRDRPLPGHDVRLVEGVDEGQALLHLQFAGMGIGVVELLAELDDGRAMALRLGDLHRGRRSEEHTSELQSLMRISYAVFCLKIKRKS